MTQIAETDSALVRLLDTCGFPGVTVLSAPHEWDAGFVQRLLSDVPAILVAFLGGEPYDDTKTSTLLDVAGKWSVLVCTGWNGRDQKDRRLGVGAGFDLLHRSAAVLHSAILTDAKGNRLPQVQVEGLGVETDSALDLANLWVGSIAVSVELPLELLPSEDCYGPLDDFLEARAFNRLSRRASARSRFNVSRNSGDTRASGLTRAISLQLSHCARSPISA